MPLFDEFRVDLVVSGHNHVYERTDPIRAGLVAMEAPAGASIPSDDAGTTYICAGGGGMGATDFAVADRNRMVRDTAPPEYGSTLVVPDGTRVTETVGWSRARYTGHSFLVVDVDPGPAAWRASMRVRMVTMDGAVLDEVTLTRRTPSWLQRHRTEALAGAAGVVAAGLAGAVLLGRRGGAPHDGTAADDVPPPVADPVDDEASAPVLPQPASLGPEMLDEVLQAVEALVHEDVDDDVECFEADDSRYLDAGWLPWPFVTDGDATTDDVTAEAVPDDGTAAEAAGPQVSPADLPAPRRPEGSPAASGPPRDVAGSPPRR